MTEAEWLSSCDPEPLLQFLDGRVSDRKLRLFLCACGRAVPLLDGRVAWETVDRRCQATLLVAERYADGLVGAADLRAAAATAREARFVAEGAILNHWNLDGSADPSRYDTDATGYDGAELFERALAVTVGRRYVRSASGRVWSLTSHAKGRSTPAWTDAESARLLRCIFGNPFHPVAVEASLLTWRNATIPRLARRAYEERKMPEGTLDEGQIAALSDALEGAGCQDAQILEHLRSGPHYRGCFVVDAVLGKG